MQDEHNKVVHDGNAWRVVVDGVMRPQRYPDERSALAALRGEPVQEAAKGQPEDHDNHVVQDVNGVWRVRLDGQLQPQKYANQREALAAHNAARP